MDSGPDFARRAGTIQLIPPINFGMVDENLYRCGMPNELNFPFMERLRLRKVIYLAPEEPSQPFKNFMDDNGIVLERLGWKNEQVRGLHKSPWKPISEDTVLAALEIIQSDTSNYAGNQGLVVVCGLGRHRTGTVIACFRKLQRWNLVSILEEYRRYTGEKFHGPRAMVNEQFIELFDTDLVGKNKGPATADVKAPPCESTPPAENEKKKKKKKQKEAALEELVVGGGGASDAAGSLPPLAASSEPSVESPPPETFSGTAAGSDAMASCGDSVDF